MRHTLKNSVTAGLFLIAALSTAQNDPYAATKALQGKKLPAISLKMLDGSTLTNKNFAGKVVVLDVFATWCGPCRAAAPKLQKMHEEFGSKGLVMIGANAGERNQGNPLSLKEYTSLTSAYQKEHKYTYKFSTAADDVMKTLSVRAFPSFFIVDRKGVIREVQVGFDEQSMRKTVAKLLAEK